MLASPRETLDVPSVWPSLLTTLTLQVVLVNPTTDRHSIESVWPVPVGRAVKLLLVLASIFLSLGLVFGSCVLSETLRVLEMGPPFRGEEGSVSLCRRASSSCLSSKDHPDVIADRAPEPDG
jgi:hypothetical protein